MPARLQLVRFFISVALGLGIAVPLAAESATSRDSRHEAHRRHGLDPGSPLESRVKGTAESVPKTVREAGPPGTTARILDDAEAPSSNVRSRFFHPCIGGSWANGCAR